MDTGGHRIVDSSRKMLNKLEERLPFLKRVDSVLSITQEMQPVLRGTDIMLNVADEMNSSLTRQWRCSAPQGITRAA